ncbi:MAG TPA: gliding motility-associated C-terminal domain-containing protein [Chitinophagales bacterium]|nr:gliding motility-associated C-terminal domain-containing protein [Chitinophagales bacterium]
MKHYPLLVVFILSALYSYAQPLNLAPPATKASVCYNDGTILANATGGTGPYVYSIISGPTLPGVTYPVSADSAGYFLSLHSGTYTVKVTDSNGGTAQQTVTVGGNYQFPQLTTTTVANTITVTPIPGKPPYTYSLSTSGPNGPFGAPQSSPVFAQLCNGTYYIRILDSCGNFYTSLPVVINQRPLTTNAQCQFNGTNDVVTAYVPDNTYGSPPFRYIVKNGNYTDTNSTGQFVIPAGLNCPSTIYTIDICGDTAISSADCHPLDITLVCSNFNTATATVAVAGGTPPFVFRFYGVDSITGTSVPLVTQNNGNFTNLPYPNMDATATFEVTDACGRKATISDTYLDFEGHSDCPFNGKLYISEPSGAIGGVTATCLTCNPVQTITTTPIVFNNVEAGLQTIRITDSCGETRDKVIRVPDSVAITGTVEFISCNDVLVKAFTSDGLPIDSGVTFSLYGSNNTFITSNTTGIFSNLATGVYKVVLSYDLCKDGEVSFYIPHMNGYCTVPYFDTNCELRMIVRYSNPDLPEMYSLVDSNAVKYNEAPAGPGNGINFNVPPGRYTLVSDSGCSVNQDFGVTSQFSEQHFTNCINEGLVRLVLSYSNSSGCVSPRPFRFTLETPDNTLLTPGSFVGDTAIFADLDTGIYIARVYLKDSIVVFNGDSIANGNQTCFLDSMVIYVGPHSIPQLNTENVTVCGQTEVADIPFTISGGFPPFYISIAGYPPINTYSTFGILPNIPLGSYTMIVNDTCGISSSLSVSVIDSCLNCDTVKAELSNSGLNVCAGDTVYFQNTGFMELSYQWIVNNAALTDTLTSIFVVVDSSDILVQLVASRYICTDTASVTVRPSSPPVFDLGPDTSFCQVFRHTLSTGISNTQWSTGTIGEEIDINTPGLYIASVAGLCSTVTDSVNIEIKDCISDLDIPDAFTPNGDGTNDFFTVFGTNINEYRIRIYNRWGELVYDSNDATELSDLQRGWDGTHRGNLQSVGVFVYYVDAAAVDGKTFNQKGNLTLIR